MNLSHKLKMHTREILHPIHLLLILQSPRKQTHTLCPRDTSSPTSSYPSTEHDSAFSHRFISSPFYLLDCNRAEGLYWNQRECLLGQKLRKMLLSLLFFQMKRVPFVQARPSTLHPTEASQRTCIQKIK